MAITLYQSEVTNENKDDVSDSSSIVGIKVYKLNKDQDNTSQLEGSVKSKTESVLFNGLDIQISDDVLASTKDMLKARIMRALV